MTLGLTHRGGVSVEIKIGSLRNVLDLEMTWSEEARLEEASKP